MRSKLLTIAVFMLQESASMAARLAALRDAGNINVWSLHILFVIATSVDIALGYAAGKYLHTHFFRNSRLERWLKRQAKPLQREHWQYFLLLAGVVNFPYINALIGSWLELPFGTVFWTTLMGDATEYAVFWLITFGVLKFLDNIYLSTAIIAGIVVTILYLLKKFFYDPYRSPEI